MEVWVRCKEEIISRLNLAVVGILYPLWFFSFFFLFPNNNNNSFSIHEPYGKSKVSAVIEDSNSRECCCCGFCLFVCV